MLYQNKGKRIVAANLLVYTGFLIIATLLGSHLHHAHDNAKNLNAYLDSVIVHDCRTERHHPVRHNCPPESLWEHLFENGAGQKRVENGYNIEIVRAIFFELSNHDEHTFDLASPVFSDATHIKILQIQFSAFARPPPSIA